MTLVEELKWRGLIKDISSPELEEKLNNGKLTFYIGTDPTADSLHVGHLSTFLISKRLKDAGHNPILLVGGGTGMIGDPRPTTERTMISKETVQGYFTALKKQVQDIFGFEVVNNNDWYKDINVIDFLRDYGKFFNVNYMLDKDIIKRRLDTGITYTEFSYMILQALDFKYLHENKGVDLQCAGSDQWGNITAGIDLIRRSTGDEVYGFTIINYLKIYTFLTKEEIEEYEKKNNEHPELREAHKALAREIITFLHGREEYDRAEKLAQSLFNNNFENLTKQDITDLFDEQDMKNVESNVNIVDMVVNVGAASSKREAREFVSSGAVSVNGEKVNDISLVVTDDMFIDNTYIIIKRGKKNYYVGRK